MAKPKLIHTTKLNHVLFTLSWQGGVPAENKAGWVSQNHLMKWAVKEDGTTQQLPVSAVCVVNLDSFISTWRTYFASVATLHAVLRLGRRKQWSIQTMEKQVSGTLVNFSFWKSCFLVHINIPQYVFYDLKHFLPVSTIKFDNVLLWTRTHVRTQGPCAETPPSYIYVELQLKMIF